MEKPVTAHKIRVLLRDIERVGAIPTFGVPQLSQVLESRKEPFEHLRAVHAALLRHEKRNLDAPLLAEIISKAYQAERMNGAEFAPMLDTLSGLLVDEKNGLHKRKIEWILSSANHDGLFFQHHIKHGELVKIINLMREHAREGVNPAALGALFLYNPQDKNLLEKASKAQPHLVKAAVLLHDVETKEDHKKVSLPLFAYVFKTHKTLLPRIGDKKYWSHVKIYANQLKAHKTRIKVT